MIRTDGKVYDRVKELLQEKGLNTEGLKIVSFGRGTQHDIMINDEHVGSYEHRGKRLTLLGLDE